MIKERVKELVDTLAKSTPIHIRKYSELEIAYDKLIKTYEYK